VSRPSTLPAPAAAPLDPDAAISVRGLVKRYGDRNAVDGLDLDIRRGEIFALLGPNGAGKTTTVEVLEGYRQRDGGEVQVLGVDPAAGGRRWKADLGIVLQSGAGDSQLTCLELLRAQAAYYPDPRDPA
jgi:ABC-2 type transport system ATP-binding protein